MYYGTDIKEGLKEWVEEGAGIITSWKDFEKFLWGRMKLDSENHYDFLDKTPKRNESDDL